MSEVSSTSSSSSTPIKNNQNELLKDNEKVPKKEILLSNFNYKDLLIKSLFNYKDFKNNYRKFWGLVHWVKTSFNRSRLFTNILIRFSYTMKMTRRQTKYDNAIQTIIIGSLNTESKKKYI